VHPSLLPVPDTVDPLLLAEIASGLARTVEPADIAGPRLLLRTAGYTAWQLAWPVAARWTSDRPDSIGALHVVRGELHERWTDLRHLDGADRAVRAGDTIALGRGLSVEVDNAGDEPAVVVYVASPPREPLRLQRARLRLVS
jgi:hypothetical protein